MTAMKNRLPLAFLPLLILISCDGPSKKAFQGASAEDTGYRLQFGHDFNPGMNFVDDFGISVALIIDVSGSMKDPPQTGGAPKYIQAAQAMATVAGYLETLAQQQPDLKIQVAVFTFNSRVIQLMPMTTLDHEGIRQLKAIARPESFLPEDKTAIGLAIEAGARVLAQSGTILNSLIVVTDGENTAGIEPVDAIDALYHDRNTASTEDLRVTTSSQLLSFIGFDIKSAQFQTFHEMGARVTSAANQGELESSLKTLLEADITKLEGN